MPFPKEFQLIKRHGNTTPTRFHTARCTPVVKTMPSVPVEPQLSRVPPTVQTELECIGLGWAQCKIMLLAGGVWFAYHCALYFSFLTADVISKEFGLSYGQKGLLSSTIQAGCVVGNLCSGVCLQWGRRPVVLVSLFGTAIFAWSGAACSAYYPLIGTRFMTGVLLGIGMPATVVLTTESTPVAWRAIVTGCVISSAGSGELFAEYVVGQDNADLDRISWRRDSWIAFAPVFWVAVLAWFFLFESPLHAALSGRTEEAMAILQRMAHDNASPVLIRGVQIPTSPTAAEASPLSMGILLQKLEVILGPNLWYPACVGMYNMFVYNIFNIGSGYAFPQILIEEEAKAPANLLFFATLCSSLMVPLCLIPIFACRRKTNIIIYSIMAVASCAAVGYSVGSDRLVTIEIGVVGTKMAVTLGMFVHPQYAAEVFPSTVRAHGTAICIAAGKLGAMLAPVAFEWLDHIADAATFFHCVAMVTVPCLILVIWLPVDTATKMLEDDMPQENLQV